MPQHESSNLVPGTRCSIRQHRRAIETHSCLSLYGALIHITSPSRLRACGIDDGAVVAALRTLSVVTAAEGASVSMCMYVRFSMWSVWCDRIRTHTLHHKRQRRRLWSKEAVSPRSDEASIVCSSTTATAVHWQLCFKALILTILPVVVRAFRSGRVYWWSQALV